MMGIKCYPTLPSASAADDSNVCKMLTLYVSSTYNKHCIHHNKIHIRYITNIHTIPVIFITSFVYEGNRHVRMYMFLIGAFVPCIYSFGKKLLSHVIQCC